MDDTTAFGIAAFSGVIAVIGSMIGASVAVSNHAFSERQKEKIEKRNKRAEKLEELVSAIHEEERWIENMKTLGVFEQLKLEIEPIGKIVAILRVYFQDLTPEAYTYLSHINMYKSLFCISTAVPDDKEIKDKLNEITRTLKKSTWSLERIESYAKSELQ
jgi:hypothetical protein